jgi:hypothetical protein
MSSMAILSPVHDAGQAAQRNPGDEHSASVETHHFDGRQPNAGSISVDPLLPEHPGPVRPLLLAPFGLSPALLLAARR